MIRLVFALWMLASAWSNVYASALYPDEPAGWNQLVRHQFSDKTNGGVCVDYYPSQTYAMILGSPSMGISPPNFLREIKPAGSDIGGTQLECFFPARSGVFWGFNLRTSNPFGGYNNGMNKIGFVMSTGPGSGAAWGLHYYGASNGSRVIAIFLQSGPAAGNNCHVSSTFGDCAGGVMEFLPNVNSAPIAEGVEHRVEVTMVRSTTNTSQNGILRIVIDGVLRTYQTNVNFPQFDFVSVQTNHTWDGQCSQRNPAVGPTTPPNDCRPYDDYYDWGDWYVSSGVGGVSPSPTPPPPPPLPPNMPTNLRVQ